MIGTKTIFKSSISLARGAHLFSVNYQDVFKDARKLMCSLSANYKLSLYPQMHFGNHKLNEPPAMFKRLSIFNGNEETIEVSQNHIENGSSSFAGKEKPRLKPPIILIFTNDRPETFQKLASFLRHTLLADTYTVGHLSLHALENHPWINENCACLLIIPAENRLTDRAWTHLRDYVNKAGKTVFLCSNTLTNLLTRTTEAGDNVLENTFRNYLGVWMAENKFKQFLNESLLVLAEGKQELDQTLQSERCPFSISISKKKGQPMLFLIFQKDKQHVNAIFTDSTPDQLGDGQHLTHMLERLGVKTQRSHSQAPQLTRGYLIFQKDRLLLDIKGLNYGTPCGDKPKLIFESTSRLANGQAQSFPTPTSDLVPIEICQRKEGLPSCAGFDSHQYFSGLRTTSVGRALVYLPVCETTLSISKTLLDLFPYSDQFIMVAGRQTRGRGRGGNEWISPRGCSMVTFNYNIPMHTQIARSINFVQHVTAVAAVDAATDLLGDKRFPLKIKWPNDLYYKRSRKMGGVLVSASYRADRFECMISCGLNINNTQPNGCVNDFLNSDCHKKLHIEEFIAELMNKFERHLHLFETDGKEEFIRKYCAKWMHTNEEVSILRADGSTERVVIIGLDSDGYLKVRGKQSGLVYSVQDDGNSFDMLNGLIHKKH